MNQTTAMIVIVEDNPGEVRLLQESLNTKLQSLDEFERGVVAIQQFWRETVLLPSS